MVSTLAPENIPAEIGDPFDYTRRHILLYRLPIQVEEALVTRLRRASQGPYTPSVPRQLTLFSLFIIGLMVVSLAASLITSGVWRWDIVVLHLLLAATTLTLQLSAELGIRRGVQMLIDGGLPLQKEWWDRLCGNLTLEWLWGVVGAVGTAIITYRVYETMLPGLPLPLSSYFACAIMGFWWGMGFHIGLVTALRTMEIIGSYPFTLYAFKPQLSVFVMRVSDFQESILWSNSAALVALLAPWVVLQALGPTNNLIMLIPVIISFGGLVVQILLFIHGQLRIGGLIYQKRLRDLKTIQDQIASTYTVGNPLDEATSKLLTPLIGLHDKIADATEMTLARTRTFRFITTFIPSLIAIVLANFQTFQSIFPWL